MNLLAMTGLQLLVCSLFVIVCTLLIIVILLQKGRGGGLAGAFGGGGGQSAFGAKTGDVFTVITIGLTFAFIVMACIGTFVFVPTASTDVLKQEVNAPQDAGDTGTAGDTGEAPNN